MEPTNLGKRVWQVLGMQRSLDAEASSDLASLNWAKITAVRSHTVDCTEGLLAQPLTCQVKPRSWLSCLKLL